MNLRERSTSNLQSARGRPHLSCMDRTALHQARDRRDEIAAKLRTTRQRISEREEAVALELVRTGRRTDDPELLELREQRNALLEELRLTTMGLQLARTYP